MTDSKNRENDRPRTGSSAAPKNETPERPMTEDEKIDEAIRESFGTSDPPSYSGSTGIGAPEKRRQTGKPTDAKTAEQANKERK